MRAHVLLAEAADRRDRVEKPEDYARFGRFMLDGGLIDGRQAIAEAWMQGAVRGPDSEGAPERGYGYLWWTGEGGSYSAVGIFGQMLHVDPSRGLVIVQLAAWPKATSRELVAARRALVDAIAQAVDREGAGPRTGGSPGA